MDEEQIPTGELEQEIADLRAEFESFKKTPTSLPFLLDAQTESVLEQKFSQHSALGRSSKTSTQSIADTTETKVVWESSDFTNEIVWDSTNYRFTIRRAGKYQVTAGVLFSSVAANSIYELLIYKNGSEYSRSADNSSAAGNVLTAKITDLLSLVPGDYIEIYVYHSSGGAKSIAGTSKLCFFSITKQN